MKKIGIVLVTAALSGCAGSREEKGVFVPEEKTGAAIQKAIDAAFAAGGGRVVVGPGDWSSGSLRLRSNVELHLEKGARIIGGTKSEDYFSFPEGVCSIRPEGSSRVFLYAWDEEGVAITGAGVIDGQGPAFFDPTTRKPGLRFWTKPACERPRMVQLVNCRNVRLQGVTFKDSPGWTMLIRCCQDVEVEAIRVEAEQRMINSDGIDFDGCRHVRVRDSDFRTGDDCLIMRAMREAGSDTRIVCEDVLVENCRLDSACQCIRMGCPSDDTIRNVIFRGIRMSGWNGIYFNNPARYLRPTDEGYLDVSDIRFEGFTGGVTGSAIQIDVEAGIRLRGVRDILFRDFDVRSDKPLRFVGNIHTKFERVRFENVTVNGVRQADGEVAGDFSEAGPLVRRDTRSWETKRSRGSDEKDIVIYGATPAGLAAAVQARKMGLEPVIVEPSQEIGGLTTGGLGQTDIGNKQAIGGISRQFYRAVKAHYDDPKNWTRETAEEYAARRGPGRAPDPDAMWTFEPSAARKILDLWVRDWALVIHRGERLDRGKGGVTLENGRIAAIRTESGKTFRAKVFIDCTYEGDLMAAAGVSYTVGREPNERYGETISGIQRALTLNHQFLDNVDPYVRKGDPSSGLLPFVEKDVDLPDGAGDSRVQAYCFRMCLTDDPENRIPFAKPEGYDPLDYELLLRNLEAKGDERNNPVNARGPWINSPMPNRKTDTNNRTGFSTDFVGGADRWPEASYAEREEIAKRHLRYQQGLMWTLANDPRVPELVRNEVARWGMCRDEFVGERGNGWQNQLYVREARRMVGEYVMTEANCRGTRRAERSIGLGAYGMDSHNIRRYVAKDGFVRNEGNIEDYNANPPGSTEKFRRFPPYPIDYGAIIPKCAECRNLFVPVCLSASHMAFGSIRMEPVFFVLGQSAATAAAIAIEKGCDVQDVDYVRLRELLLEAGQVLE